MRLTRKISIKNQLKERQKEIDLVEKYFKEYGLENHFTRYINALADKKDLPENINFE
jgi:hypothetical protein